MLVQIAFCVFLVYYLYRSVAILIRFSFVNHSLWEQYRLVRGVLDIPIGVAMIADQIFGVVELYLLILHNPLVREPLQWLYDPTDFKTIALALVLLMLGWGMRDAMEIDQTSKGFV